VGIISFRLSVKKMKTEEENSMVTDRRSKILFAVLAIAIVGLAAASFVRFIVLRDYIIETQVDCDPSLEACFMWECDPESEEDGEMCTGNPEEDTWYYKIIRKNAMNIPICNSAADECEPITCIKGELECEYILCEENNEGGVLCSDPADFNEDTEAENVSLVDDGTSASGNPQTDASSVLDK